MDLSASNGGISRLLLSYLDVMRLRLSRAVAIGLSLDASRRTRWATALLVTAAMTVLEMVLLGIMREGALLPPIAAVVIATMVGGRSPGLIALALNVIIAEYIVIPPYYQFVLPWPKDVISMTMFVLVASLAWYVAVLFRDELAAVRERDELMAAAAHDLRNPLMALNLAIAQVQALTDSGEPSKRAALIAAFSLVDRQVTRMTVLIEGLLGASRTRATRREQFDLAELVSEVVHEMSSELESSRCTLQATLKQTVGMWNRMGLKRAITNLLTNAVLHAPGSLVRIDVTRQGQLACFEVADHGPGIDRSALSRILDRYQHASVGGRPSGTGLGLYIVRQIVEAHGGKITVHSTLGEGARFVVRLPLGPVRSIRSVTHSVDKSRSSASAQASLEFNGNAVSFHRGSNATAIKPDRDKTVLIVEDDLAIRDALRELIEKDGRNVLTARDGLEALDCARSIPRPRLILLDLSMPRMNGYEFLHRLSADPSIAGIPTVVLSGSASEVPSGVTDVLAKPIDVRRLLTLIAQYC